MITSIISKLPFINKEQTIDYYVNQLGFILKSDYNDYMIMELDKAEIHFFSYPDLKPDKSDFMVYVRIDNDIEDPYQRIQDNDVMIHPNGKLELKPWKQKEFSIIDTNGTLLTFGQAIN